MINLATLQATIAFWSDQLAIALRKRDRERRDFCDQQIRSHTKLLYQLIDEADGEVS